MPSGLLPVATCGAQTGMTLNQSCRHLLQQLTSFAAGGVLAAAPSCRGCAYRNTSLLPSSCCSRRAWLRAPVFRERPTMPAVSPPPPARRDLQGFAPTRRPVCYSSPSCLSRSRQASTVSVTLLKRDRSRSAVIDRPESSARHIAGVQWRRTSLCVRRFGRGQLHMSD